MSLYFTHVPASNRSIGCTSCRYFLYLARNCTDLFHSPLVPFSHLVSCSVLACFSPSVPLSRFSWCPQEILCRSASAQSIFLILLCNIGWCSVLFILHMRLCYCRRQALLTVVSLVCACCIPSSFSIFYLEFSSLPSSLF